MPGLSRPSHEQVSRVMAIINAKENGPVFIHCKRGADRTGTVVAIYRISARQLDYESSDVRGQAARTALDLIRHEGFHLGLL